MKKTLEFLTMPLTQILVGIIGLVLVEIVAFNKLYWIIFILLSIVLYAASGYVFSKLENKRLKVLSSIVSALVIALAFIAIFISAQMVNTDAFYAIFFISPFGYVSTFLTQWIGEYISESEIFIYSVLTLICSLCPILISVLSAKLFELKRIKDIYSNK